MRGHKILPLTFNNRKKINEEFFDTWTENSAYVFGFFLADGCLTRSSSKNGHDFYKLAFTQKTSEILEKIKLVMDSGHKITKRVRKNNGGICYYLQISNKHITKKLMSFGLKTNKTTEVVTIPDIQMDLIHHMVRGFCDGDGSTYGRRIQLDFSEKTTLHEQFLTIFKNLELPKPNIYYKQLKDGRTVQLVRLFWGKRNDRFAIRNWMYNNATIYMDRKKNECYTWKETV
jgi:hypothetical protein